MLCGVEEGLSGVRREETVGRLGDPKLGARVKGLG
jgi:hypothetical protein